MTRVGVVGATGYTGVELVRLLSRHPKIKLAALTAERNVGQPIWKLFPSVLKETDLVCQPLEVEPLSKACDFLFLALPHKAAMEVAPGFLERGLKVVDLSADFRLTDPQVSTILLMGRFDFWGKGQSAVSRQPSVRGRPRRG